MIKQYTHKIYKYKIYSELKKMENISNMWCWGCLHTVMINNSINISKRTPTFYPNSLYMKIPHHTSMGIHVLTQVMHKNVAWLNRVMISQLYMVTPLFLVCFTRFCLSIEIFAFVPLINILTISWQFILK